MDGLFTITFFGFAILVPIFVLIGRRKKKKEYYSFGLEAAREVVKYLLKKDYVQAEDRLAHLSSDDMTQTMDYIALRLNENALKAWKEESDKKEFPELALGVYFLHKAWKERGGGWGSELSDEMANKYLENLRNALIHLEEIPDSSPVAVEKHTRLIRVYMGFSKREKMKESFRKALEGDKEKLWAYVAYCTAIQPKWGGTHEEINDFVNDLPNNEFIKQIIHLKLLWDGMVMQDNYMGANVEDGEREALNYALKLDQQLKGNLPTSVHRYMLYNYMSNILIDGKKRRLALKYLNLSKGYLALDPHGFEGG